MALSIKEGVQNLERICIERKCEKILFDFYHNNLSASIVYFSQPKVLLIGLKDFSIGWLINIQPNYNISMVIPNESFKILKNYLDEVGEVMDGEKTYIKHTTEPFFNGLKTAMEAINIDNVEVPTDIQIKNQIEKTKTSDKKYDKDGDKPYFKTWRRNGIKTGNDDKATYENLIKTGRLFGEEIKQLCKMKRVSSVWSNTPTNACLDFICIDLAKKKINKKS